MPPDPLLILSLDTSTAHCAVALVQGGGVLASRREAMQRGQAERLMPLVAEILADANVEFGELDRLAVGCGPGNFTGVRISVAAARGLALALTKPAIGVTGFEAMAFGTTGTVLVVLNGPRDALYCQLFDDGQPLGDPEQTTLDRLAARDWPTGLSVIGSAGERVAKALDAVRLGAGTEADPVAIAQVAAARDPQNQQRPAPLYLREPDAALPRTAPPARL